MGKNLKSHEVIGLISKKISLKKELRSAKQKHDDKKIHKISEKIETIESELHSTPLNKS